MSKQIDVAVIGASGYTGLELLKLLAGHPVFRPVYIATSEGDTQTDRLHPALEGVMSLPVEKADPDTAAKRAELAFLALPHKTAMGFAKVLMQKGMKVVDLSADYRLERAAYEAHYCPHQDPDRLKEAVYGLPEYYRASIKGARLVANPGCYPTATLLALLPFMAYHREGTPIFVDAKSGVSGAGKKLSETTHFVTINENHFPYNPFKHRHAPEIVEKVRQLSGREPTVRFVPHLLPVTRGMLCNVYMQVSGDFDPEALLKERYAKEPFVRIRNRPVDIKSVAGTHYCDLFALKEGDTLFVSAAIDNLLRGASSQALANANILCGLEETLGLPTVAYVP